MNIGDWVSAVQNALAAVAIVAGAIWAYYKFLKGRTFSHRAELSVAGTLLEGQGRSAIQVRVSLKNLGLTKLPLRLKSVRVLAMREPEWNGGDWNWIKSARAFEAHEWLEPQEIVTDELLIPLGDDESGALAYLVQLIVIKQGGPLQWTAQQVVAGSLTSLRRESELPGSPVVTGKEV